MRGIWIFEKLLASLDLPNDGWGTQWKRRRYEDNDIGNRKGEEVRKSTHVGLGARLRCC